MRAGLHYDPLNNQNTIFIGCKIVYFIVGLDNVFMLFYFRMVGRKLLSEK